MQSVQGFLDTIKEKVSSYLVYLKLDSARFVEILSYVGVAFLAGFLFKRFFRTAFIVAAGLLGILFLFNYFGFISVNWIRLQAITGVHSTDTLAGLGTTAAAWIKQNLLISLSAFVSFIVGYWVG